MNSIQELAQSFQMALKSLQMYTAAHPRSQEAVRILAGSVADWLQDRQELQLSVSSGKLFVDGSPVEIKSPHISALCSQFSERQVAGFILRRDVPPDELQAMLDVLILKPAKLEELGGAAKVIEGKKLRYISLSQISYREIREGEGGDEEAGGPALRVQRDAQEPKPAAPEPLAIDIAEALDHWRKHLEASLRAVQGGLEGDTMGGIPAADLGGLGPGALEAGWGPSFPSPAQLESLRQALKGLGGEQQLSILKGLNSLPLTPAGLHAGFMSLTPEIAAQAAAGLLGQGIAWAEVETALHGLMSVSPMQRAILAGLEGVPGIGADQFERLARRLDWDGLSLDDKLQRALEEGQFLLLSLDQRLEFLRQLLKTGRQEHFMHLLELLLESITHEAAPPREAAARTLANVAHWTGQPEFPAEAEGPMLDGFKSHFGWEPLPPIHRASEEGLAAMFRCLLERGEVSHVLDMSKELEGLLAFLGDVQEWRETALKRLLGSLSAPEALAACVEALHKSEPDAVPLVFAPYFEFLGEPGAAGLIRILGEEPDRKRRGRLLDLIRALGPLALPALMASLQAPTWYLVRNTLNLLADVGDAGMVEAVTGCLKHEDGRVRRAAVRALWKLGGPAGAPPLLALLPTTDPETQVEILFGLGQVQSGMAIYVLTDFAKNPEVSERLRVRALETLGHIGHPTSVPLLAEFIRRRGRIFSTAEPTEIRLAAARALVAIGTAPALEALRKLVGDEPRSKDRPALQQILDTPRRSQGVL